eukprot:PITA_26729
MYSELYLFSQFCLSAKQICKQATIMAEEQVKIKMLGVSTVVPAIPTEKHTMFLSSLDLFWIPVINTHSLLFYKLSPGMEFSTVTDMLKRSLSLVLVDFYPIAGRLSNKGSGETSRPEIDCNDCGVEFVEASIDVPFEDLEKDDFRHKGFFEQLIRIRDGSKFENYQGPFLSVQVTAFPGGGISIGATLHHVVADGVGFWHFMTCWAECSRGSPISNRPEHMRTIFKREQKTNCAMPNISFRAQEVVTGDIKGAQIFKFMRDDLQPTNGEINGGKSDCNINSDSSVQKYKNHQIEDFEISRFHFDEEMIGKLKERARARSSFVAVSAHFWRCVMKAREVPEEEAVDFGIIANSRGRVRPPLPATFFGNCACMGFARTRAKQLLGQDIRFAAALIQELINSCTTEEQFSALTDWADSRIRSGSPLPSLALQTLGGRYFVGAGNSPKFPVYELDFGWGKPLRAQTAAINDIGGLMFFPGRDDGGRSMDIYTRLPRQQMETLKRILMIIPD